ncbi:MAG: hypothetical protein AAFW81_04915 [Pseudomonadota bacterium]
MGMTTLRHMFRASGPIALSLSVISTSFAATPAYSASRLAVLTSDECIMTEWPPQSDERFLPFLALLGPAILPRLVDMGLGLASGKLRTASADRNQIIKIGQTSSYFLEANLERGVYVPHSDLTCVIVAHGDIDVKGEPSDNIADVWAVKADDFNRHGLVFKRDPDFYYEGIVQFSEDGQSFKIRTAHLYYDGSIANGRSRKSDREVAISFTFVDGTGQAFAESAIPLSEIDVNTTLTAEALGIDLTQIETEEDLSAHALAQFETNWMASLGPDDASVSRLIASCKADGCPRLSYSNDDGAGLQAKPYTLKVQVTETGQPNAILEFLANTIDTTRPIASTAIASQFLPKDVFDPNNAEWWRKRQAAYQACQEYKNAQSSLAGSPLDPGMRYDVNTAYKELQEAYAQAGMPNISIYMDTVLGCRLSGG